MGNHWVTSRLIKFMNRRSPLFYSLSIIFFFLLALILTSSSSTNSCLVFRCQIATKADFLSQVLEKASRENEERKLEEVVLPMILPRVRRRRILYRLGSSPPRCNWKCGPCTPCKPVHVSVPPGTPVTTEYYPEAWRCKCGNKLYMP